MLALGLALSIAGCSRQAHPLHERELLETVPARARVIVSLNLDALLKSAACKSADGKISLTKDLTRLIQLTDSASLPLLGAVAQSGDVADLRRVVIIADTMGLIVTAPLRSELRKDPAEDLNVKGAPTYLSQLLGDIEVIDHPDGVSMARSSAQVWWTSGVHVPMGHVVDYVVGEADRDPISAHQESAAFLERTSQAKAIVRCPLPINPLGEPIDAVYAELRLADRSLSLSVWGLRSGSKASPLAAMPAVDPAALGEMPPGMMAYAAAGVNDILPMALKRMSEDWPLATRIGVGAVIDVMNTDGGTIALGIAPGGSAESIRRMDLDSWLVKGVIPVDPDKGYDAAELIDMLSAGKLHSRADSVYLEVANYDLDAFEISTQADIYGTPKAVVYASVPYNHQAMKAFRLRNGYTLDFLAYESEATAVLTVHGPASYILPAAIADALTIISRQKGQN